MCILCIALASNWAVKGQVRISEVHPFGDLEDSLGRGEDWVELINQGQEPVSLASMRLSDDPDNWEKWSLPDVMLGPNERILFLCSGRDVGLVHHWECPVDDQEMWRYMVPNQALNTDWRTLEFDDASWLSGLGSIGYGDNDDAVEVNAEVVFMRKSFIVVNPDELIHGLLAVDYDDGYVAFLNGHEVARSQTMQDVSVAHNANAGGLHEAVLYGGGIPESVPFDPREWLVSGTNVLAVQVHNENANSSDFTARPFLALARSQSTPVPYGWLPSWWAPEASEFHTNFKLKPGEPVILSAADGELLDLATLPQELRSSLSMGRSGGSEDWCFYTDPTPGEPNSGVCLSQIAPTPNVEPASGWFTATSVEATPGVPSGAPGQNLPPMTLRFTTDGSEPTESSLVFTGFWTPSQTTVLSVRAFGEGLVPSETVDRTYFIDEPTTGLQKVSIITHPDHLWDWNTGIYVSGPNAGNDYPFFGSNFWEPWSRESRLTWFDDLGVPVANARLDLEIHGGWSRAEAQRSFRLDFKKNYTGPLQHDVFFSKPDIYEFGNLNLRNGGQASWENKFQDAFYGELALETHVFASGWRPVEVYLNGDYWGVYGAREKADEQMVEDNLGWDKNEVDLVSAFTSLNGGPSAFEATVDPMLEWPDGSLGFREAFAQHFDVSSYIDYHIFEIHGQNVDWIAAPWGQNNVKFFRANSGDGLWRPMLYDTDACFGAWGTSPYENYLNLTLNPPYASRFTDLFRKVLADDHYRCEFATRTCDLLETKFSPDLFDVRLANTAANMAPAMVHHIDEWESPASIDYWQSRLELMRNHNEERANPERIQVQDEFGYDAPKMVTLNWSPPFAGEVTVNEMHQLGTGWSGQYFGECPIRLAAIPGPGYGFLNWQNNIHVDLGLVDPSDPFIEVALQQDDSFYAIFGACMEGTELAMVANGDGLSAQVEGATSPLIYQWYFDGILVGQGMDHAPSEEGEYILTASNGECTLITEPFAWPNEDEGQVVSIEASASMEELAALSVVPNPTAGPVVLTGVGEGDVRVFTSAGELCFSAQDVVLPFVLDASFWSPGVYAAQLVTRDGSQSVRFVVR